MPKFQEHQKVKIKHPFTSEIISGELLSQLESVLPESQPCYWVQYQINDSSFDVGLFYESELEELNPPTASGGCTCGAKYTSTGIHYRWCDYGYNF